MKALINKIWRAVYPPLGLFFFASGVFNLIRLTWAHFQIALIILSIPLIAIAGILLLFFFKDEILAYRRGYKITTSGEPKNETVTYREGRLRLRFPRQAHSNTYILTVIDEVAWKEEMPDLAKDRRDIILQRLIAECGRVEPTMTVELDVVYLSNFVPNSYHWLRAFMWPDKYKKAKSVAHRD